MSKYSLRQANDFSHLFWLGMWALAFALESIHSRKLHNQIFKSITSAIFEFLSVTLEVASAVLLSILIFFYVETVIKNSYFAILTSIKNIGWINYHYEYHKLLSIVIKRKLDEN